MELFNATMTQLEKSMDMRMVNQRLIASNIANLDTPGYQARRLDFEASLARAMEGNDAPVVEVDETPGLSLDGNNVDIDQELAEMSRNRTMYSLTAQVLSAKFRQIGMALDQNQ